MWIKDELKATRASGYFKGDIWHKFLAFDIENFKVFVEFWNFIPTNLHSGLTQRCANVGVSSWEMLPLNFSKSLQCQVNFCLSVMFSRADQTTTTHLCFIKNGSIIKAYFVLQTSWFGYSKISYFLYESKFQISLLSPNRLKLPKIVYSYKLMRTHYWHSKNYAHWNGIE